MTTQLRFLDVNVPMYAAGKQHPYKQSCVWLMKQIAQGPISVAIDTEIVQEVLYRYGYLKRFDIGTRMARDLMVIVSRIYPVLPEDVSTAIDLFEKHAPKGVKARDVIHAAVMKNNEIKEIISTDRHFDAIEGITRLDPKVLFAKRAAE